MTRISTRMSVPALAVLSGLVTAFAVHAFPVAADAVSYAACQRVFPDPHAHWPSPTAAPKESPWARGNAACRASDFVSLDEARAGLEFLAGPAMFEDFIEVYDLSDPNGRFAEILDLAGGEGFSAGLPQTLGEREKSPMLLIRVTDEEYTDLPIGEREHFVFNLSIHGIERAGVEGGLRAIEELATWASCEKHGEQSAAHCSAENAGPGRPHPLLVTQPETSVTAGDALRQSSVWFVLANPDGWRRGDKQQVGYHYQRHNGNGMDMNRDWPTRGWTFRPYTPWSEPETRATGKVLKAIKAHWSGGIDLHGLYTSKAFSFTMMGGNQRDFGQHRRTMEFVRGAWTDAEVRLAWHPIIKPNTEPESCVYPAFPLVATSEDPDCDPSGRLHGVQWGTWWDTLGYMASGTFGAWMTSPQGLHADGVDNEMSLSHFSNCGLGNCYLTDFEQLHVDGNKSLIYASIHHRLTPDDERFHYRGRVGYIYNPDVVAHRGDGSAGLPPAAPPPQPQESSGQVLHTRGDSIFEFTVVSPAKGHYSGGLFAEFSFSNVQGAASPAIQNEVAIDRKLEAGEDGSPEADLGDGWQRLNSYFHNGELIYLQAGARIDVNSPRPGRYRLRVSGSAPLQWSAQIHYTADVSWPDPGQLPYTATNMRFFEMLAAHVPDAAQRLVPLELDDILDGRVDLATFDTIVATDDAFVPGARGRERSTRDQMAVKALAFARGGGNLVLTDNSLRALGWMGVIDEQDVVEDFVYGGHLHFEHTTATGETIQTYADPLATGIDQPGSAAGPNQRRQIVEPVPLGYEVTQLNGANASTLPQWSVIRAAWERAGGRTVGTIRGGNVSYGEIPVGTGVIRVLGAMLPMPTNRYDHPYGLGDYALTWAGYELSRNLLSWEKTESADRAAMLPVAEHTAGGSPGFAMLLWLGCSLLSRRGTRPWHRQHRAYQ